jgi:hypothetical protein
MLVRGFYVSRPAPLGSSAALLVLSMQRCIIERIQTPQRSGLNDLRWAVAAVRQQPPALSCG